MTGIYKTDINIELNRTQKILKNDINYEAIKKFSRDIKLLDNLSEFRVLIYIGKLRPLAEFLKDKFLDPSEDDLKDSLEYFENKGNAPATIEIHKQTMKKFYYWYFKNDEKYNKVCGWIKIRNNVNRHKKAEDMITYDEYNSILDNVNSLRDKALISLLYDSGCRIGEILPLRVRDVSMDDNGLNLHVAGKTGERIVFIIGDSIAFLRQYLEVYKYKNDPDSPLFMDFENNTPLKYDATRKMLNRAVKRAGIKKRVHPHLFRHSYASRYAEILPESILKSQLGWTPRSNMVENYIHLSGNQVRNAILKANGMPIQEKTIEKHDIRKCQRCGELNESTAAYCHKCWFPLYLESSVELQDKQKAIENSLYEKSYISPEIEVILRNMPEDKKESILSAVIEAALKERTNEKK